MKNRSTLILVSLGLLLWVLSATFDYLTLPSQSFFDWLIFKIPDKELLFRAVVLTVFAVAGVALSRNSMSQYAKLVNSIEELEKSNGEYASLLNNLPVGVYRATVDGRILDANRQFAETLGYKEVKELQKVNLNDACVDKFDRQEHLQRLREAPVFAEFELRRTDGRTVWVRDYPKATMNADGTIAYVDGVCVESHGIDAIMRDITEHKRLQNMKDHFIVAVTHELRTPLVSIKGYVDHIITKEADMSNSLRSKIEVVKRNTDRLLQLTNDLLNVEDVETGRLEFKFETLNLHEVITQCLEEIQPLLTDKGQEVRLEVPGKPLPVLCDRLRLNEVLVNLLTNANKFTPEGGSITIRVEEDDATVTVSISDSGIGIDKKDLERVFEPFAAIEKPTYFKGSGLGLSLTKKLVEAQRGKVWATSLGKGQGATFAFTLPKSKEEYARIHG
jgi:PAS domain S-box-containing protein